MLKNHHVGLQIPTGHISGEQMEKIKKYSWVELVMSQHGEV